MDIFKGQNLLEFSDRFKADENCKEYLAFLKSKTTYQCIKCNHRAYQSLKDFGRQCNICRHTRCAFRKKACSSDKNIIYLFDNQTIKYHEQSCC